MTEKYTLAIVGCGKVLSKHLDAIAVFKAQIELVGLCDSNMARMEALSPTITAPLFSDLEKMLQTVKPQVLVVLTPSGLHAAHSILGAKNHCHIIVEKPMALVLKDADTMIAECKASGTKLFTVNQYRFSPAIQLVREAFEMGRFGKTHLFTSRVRWSRPQKYYDSDNWRGTRKLDGGVLSNQAAHHVDLLRWFGGTVESLMAVSQTQGVQIEVDNTVLGFLRFHSGALGSIEATTAVFSKDLEASLSIIGEKGTVVLGANTTNRIDTWDFQDSSKDEIEIIRKKVAKLEAEMGTRHTEYYREILGALNGKSLLCSDGTDGRDSLALVCALYKASAKHKHGKLKSRRTRSALEVSVDALT